MATRDELDLSVKLIEELIKVDSSSEIQGAATRARDLLQRFDAAVAAQRTADAETLARELNGLAQSARQLVDQRGQPQSAKSSGWWPYVGMVVLGAVFVGLALFIARYVDVLGFSALATIEGTRPLLVIAAIVSTIAFGGALVIGSLFASEGSFEERFRRSREIFLVFSGIFGTVIGFYFGAGETKTPQLGLDATLEDATVVAHATNGTPPYTITVTYGPAGKTRKEETKTGWAKFVFDKKTDNVVPTKLSAVDSKNVRGTGELQATKDELKKAGWVLPEEDTKAKTSGK